MRGLTPVAVYDEGMVPYGTEGLRLTKEYGFAVDDPRCPILLEIYVVVVDGQPQCVDLRCRPRPGGPPVSSESLRRVPLARYVRESAELYSVRVVVYGPGSDQVLVSATGKGDEPLLARAAQQRPRQQMTDELLRDVARVYSEAESTPTLTVMRRFYLSRPTAGRWVVLARKRGFLPELPPRVRKQ